MTKRDKVRTEMFNKIRLYEQSGLSKADFCKKHRISQNLLHYWQKVHKASNTSAEEHPAFIPIMIDEHVATIEYSGASCPPIPIHFDPHTDDVDPLIWVGCFVSVARNSSVIPAILTPWLADIPTS
jgi:hypothetical protein